MGRLQGWRMSMNHLKFRAQFWIVCVFLKKEPLDFISIYKESMEREFGDHLIQPFPKQNQQTNESLQT